MRGVGVGIGLGSAVQDRPGGWGDATGSGDGGEAGSQRQPALVG
jgi:hypothetical protein